MLCDRSLKVSCKILWAVRDERCHLKYPYHHIHMSERREEEKNIVNDHNLFCLNSMGVTMKIQLKCIYRMHFICMVTRVPAPRMSELLVN